MKRISLSATAAAALSLGGVTVAVGINQDYFAGAEFLTKPQYVQQFADCMESRGWEPIAGSNDPEAPADVPAVHFSFPGNLSADIGKDAEDCRVIISQQVGESIVPAM
jgi:hypothetical protein